MKIEKGELGKLQKQGARQKSKTIEEKEQTQNK